MMRYFRLLCILPALLSLLLKPAGLRGEDRFLLANKKAGPIEIGMPIDILYTKYDRDLTKLVDLQLEGFFSPALEIYLPGGEEGNPSVIVCLFWKNNWVVDSIHVFDKRFKTDKGIGIGSTLGDIRKVYKVDWIDFGEQHLFVRADEVGMSFEIDTENIFLEDWVGKDLTRVMPDTARIESVLLTR